MSDIITGDCITVLPILPHSQYRLCLTSTPYPGQKNDRRTVPQFLEWIEQLFDLVVPLLKPNGVIVYNIMFKRTPDNWFDTRLFTAVPLIFEGLGLNCLDTYVWGKTNPAQRGNLQVSDAPGYEMVYVFTTAERPEDVVFNPQRKPYAPKSMDANGRARTGWGRVQKPHPQGARQTNLILTPTAATDGGGRPLAKGGSYPLRFAERMILQYTNPDDWVLDPCFGVGTTGRVAQETGRCYTGIEINPAEAQRAREWLAEPFQVPFFANGVH